MRIEQGADGSIGVTGDPRDARFRAMLADLPELGQQIGMVLGGKAFRRAASYAEARDLFLKGSDAHRAQAVVDHYEQTHGQPPLSLVFNGEKFVAEEKAGGSWRTMKTTQDFMWYLIHESEQFVSVTDNRFDALIKAVSSKVATSDSRHQPSSDPKKDGRNDASAASARPGLL
jgi:hypothetical protein